MSLTVTIPTTTPPTEDATVDASDAGMVVRNETGVAFLVIKDADGLVAALNLTTWRATRFQTSRRVPASFREVTGTLTLD